MKFKTTPYHFDLLKDTDRLSVFFQAIKEYDGKTGLAYDLGCGSGVLSYFLSFCFDEIIALEINSKAAKCAEDNLSDFSNVNVIQSDVFDYEFTKKANLILCEMMDTALIDEEEIPVLNHVKKFLKDDGKIIPQGVINTAQLVSMEREYIHWDEDAKYETYSDEEVYCELNFLEDIDSQFEAILQFKTQKEGFINGIKITTYTKLSEDIIAGPLPMFNPPLLIPLDEREVKGNQFIKVKLKYIMGKGIESIKTQYC